MDARQLSHAMLTELRKRGVSSVQEGQSPEIVASALGINRATMYGWLARYRNGGWSALDARKTGRTEAEARWQGDAMDLQDRNAEEPFAIEIHLCSLDCKDGWASY